jgi:Transposase IS4
MSDEEFAVDDVWFGPQFMLNESQDLVFLEEQVQGDQVSEENVVTATDTVGTDEPVTQQENSVPTQLPTEIPMAVSAEPTCASQDVGIPTKPKLKRNTKSFAKKMILARKDVFLNPLYANRVTDDSLEIVGQIKECPWEANGRQYRIEWRNPLPALLQREWLQSFLVGSEDNRKKLYLSIAVYEASGLFVARKGKRTEAAGNAIDRNNRGTPICTTRAKIEQAVGNVLDTPPVPCVTTVRAGAASVKTSSTISSLSQTSISSPEVSNRRQSGVGTRRSQDVESSTDDGEDLDEEDNMYVGFDTDTEDEDDDDGEEEPSLTSRGLGELLSDVHWNFCVDVSVDDKNGMSMYNGPNGLKARASESFNDPFECLAICGGLDYDLVTRLARNSNEYVRQFLLPKDRNGRLHGQPFVNITTEEMYHFLGITLRISLSPTDWGGYEAYFSSNNRQVLGKKMTGTDGFARHFMTLPRYKQIRAAFHPEDRTAGLGGDKCYQLRHVINTMNQAAANTKYMGSDLTFDEGGIGSRHRQNPVRQYNKDKPQKFRVNFFLMACSQSYFIHHIDVYQGANANNVGIHRAVRAMPTTQKAVLNVQCLQHKRPSSMQCFILTCIKK